ncbi:MAG: hypothetical protein C5B50_03030 [Verrucomicrobia bacterium]|nr:MAG: hypothetical protein C5B50_03030 [Verrucomicrobiota bacterium]
MSVEGRGWLSEGRRKAGEGPKSKVHPPAPMLRRNKRSEVRAWNSANRFNAKTQRGKDAGEGKFQIPHGKGRFDEVNDKVHDKVSGGWGGVPGDLLYAALACYRLLWDGNCV